jgi:flagellar hook-associated protein 1 FlgK
MSLSPVLSIAQRALLANETALEVTSNNIANVNTPGYSRQTPEFQSNLPIVNSAGVFIGTGASVRRVVQVVDELLDKRIFGAQTDTKEHTTLRDRLDSLAGVLNDIQEPSVSSQLSGFFDAVDALARNPAGLAERQTVLGRAIALAGELNRRSASVATLQRGADDAIVAAAGRANELLSQLADTNVAIVSAELKGQRANDLRDQRRAVLGELAGILQTQTVEQENGAVNVYTANGLALVNAGSVVHTLDTQGGSLGLDGFALHDPVFRDAAGNALDLPAAFAHGEIAGLQQVRDGQYVAASDALDTFAVALRDQVNAIQTAGRDLDGNATTLQPLFGGTGAGDLAVLLDPSTDPNAARKLAAATSTDPGDNTNALALADLRTTPLAALGNVTLAGYLGTEQGRIGEDALRAEDTAKATDLLSQQLETQRSAVSGVNLNEELTNLLKYQRAFQAASQVIRVANTVLDELVNIVR